MDRFFNYNAVFNQALNRIKAVRAPHSDMIEKRDLHWDEVKNNTLFDFGGEDFEKSIRVYSEAKRISISCCQFIIENLFSLYGYNTEAIPVGRLRPSVELCTQLMEHNEFDKEQIENLIDQSFGRILFAFKDISTKTLLLFKDVEECNFWKKKGEEVAPIKAAMNISNCSSCVYIYLMFDSAYLQLINYDDNTDDPGRGYNLYSVKWLFEHFFGKEEYSRFLSAVMTYISEVKSHIGYVTIKTLAPSSLINFRKNVEGTLFHFNYDVLLNEKHKQYELRNQEYIKLREYFIDEKRLYILIGTHDFAESLITAEWLFDSMKLAKAIDLTIIGMGYFKAVEQLLFELICFHKNKGFCIWNVPLDDDHIAMYTSGTAKKSDEALDLTLGAMATFVKNYSDDVFRKDIGFQTKKYIREAIYDYAELRNGYFHKDNIKRIETVKSIRQVTIKVLFLLLGAFELSKQNIEDLGYPIIDCSDYHNLCEYINYHSDKLFYLDSGLPEERLCFSCADLYSKTIENRYVQYSGVYFKGLGPNGKIKQYTEQNLPKNIYTAKFEFGWEDRITVRPQKMKKIFENGKFIGPTIAEEGEGLY